MFEYLYEWLRDISYYLILVTAVTDVLPSNSYRKYIRLFTGLVLILMLLTPVFRLFGMKETIMENLYGKFQVEYEANISEKMETVIGEQNEIMPNETFQIEVEDIVIEP